MYVLREIVNPHILVYYGYLRQKGSMLRQVHWDGTLQRIEMFCFVRYVNYGHYGLVTGAPYVFYWVYN